MTGFGGRVYEASRLTEERIELDESAKLEINEKLLYLQEHIKECPEATVTYFLPDRSKDGGAYITACGRVLKINEYDECLVLGPELSIQFDDALSIDV